MRIENVKILATLPDLGVDRLEGASWSYYTSLCIGGTTALLLINQHDSIPELFRMLYAAG
jgi:hypothetical protein